MPNKSTASAPPAPAGDLWLGIGLIGLAITTAGLTPSIRALGLGENFDPGAKAFPLGLAVILGLGGMVECVLGWKSRGTETAPTGRSKTPAILLLGLGAYVLLLPWLGFALSTVLMATGMMVWLGQSWPRAALASAGLVGLVYLLFVVAFKVPLPGGVLNLPF